MGSTVTLAGPEDAAALARLASHADSPFDVECELGRAYARIWVAREEPDAEIDGFALCWEIADEMHVIDLVVAEHRRRRGLGRALLDALLDCARVNQVRLVLLEVRAGNAAAIALYTSAGFECVGERRAYYADGEDACLMQVALR